MKHADGIVFDCSLALWGSDNSLEKRKQVCGADNLVDFNNNKTRASLSGIQAPIPAARPTLLRLSLSLSLARASIRPDERCCIGGSHLARFTRRANGARSQCCRMKGNLDSAAVVNQNS